MKSQYCKPKPCCTVKVYTEVTDALNHVALFSLVLEWESLNTGK